MTRASASVFRVLSGWSLVAAALAGGSLPLPAYAEPNAITSGLSSSTSSNPGRAARLTLDSRVEIVQQPRPDPGWVLSNLTGVLPQAWMGRVSRLRLGLSQEVLPGVLATVSGRAIQDLEEPLANPDWHDAARSRLSALRAGGQDLRPLYVAELERLSVTWTDPERGGSLELGQMVVPLEFTEEWSGQPSLALAPRFTPLTTWLSGRGDGLYEPSVGSRCRDVGVRMAVESGPFPWMVGLFNGSGPNRLDDGPEKHGFARLDWRASTSDRVGASIFWGTETLHPAGFDRPGYRIDRRRWNMHAEFNWSGLRCRGVWGRDDRGEAASIRDGTMLELAQFNEDGGSWYARGSWFVDPVALSGIDYRAREALVGYARALVPGWTWRGEACYRWEDAGATHTEDARWLTALDLRWTIDPGGDR